jgi:hypothetical protein
MPRIQIKRYLFQAAFALVIGLSLVCIRPGNAPAEEAANLEYRIKAAYLYNFTKFIVWPDADMAETQPFNLAIIGTDPFGDTLAPLTEKSVQGRPIQISRLGNHELIPQVDMLFISSQDPDEIKGILAALTSSATLTVGESPAFTGKGGMISFYTEKKKIRFEINTKAIRQKGFKVSSQLLKLARIVEGEAP